MAIDRAAAPSSATLPDDLTAVGLAGLLDLLERADALPRRPRPRRAVATRSPGAPRTLRPLPVARPVPVPRPRPAPPVTSAPASAPVPAPAGSRLRARLRAATRRLALWGAGPGAAHAAWPTAPVVVPPPRPNPLRRLASWGAGPGGAHLAWGRPAPARPAASGPVVLTELPSTPTVQPAASSPAAALPPAGTPRPVPPHRPGGTGPGLAPAGWPARPAVLRSGTGPPGRSGSARARGDPVPGTARGSPRPPPPAPD
ncbi:hypothetical protein SAMN05660690_4167 [Geodermatophilus telluris]|uniref:Uncharacterized protein n=1 Tax=Geodermatophilus telluris TaxID=1190417 RepID=A0A1G6UCI1_9ACTN|nr:hypothetical protein [Geodermatophilus telluris]SDD39100.1 hypothetical protein SAMN05660690_4167 [Geodermatophilus telluris]